MAQASEVFGLYQSSRMTGAGNCSGVNPESTVVGQGERGITRTPEIRTDLGKDRDGARLIRVFCTPGKRGHKTPSEAPEDWKRFQEYCKQDVVAERALFKKLLPAYELPERERKLLALDQKINERGIPVDLQFVRNAKALAERERERLVHELTELTGLENPNSPKQLLAWLRGCGYPYASLGKKWVDRARLERAAPGAE